MRANASSVALAIAVLASLGGAGCAIAPTTCDRSERANPAVFYSEGTVENGVYMSSDWDGELLNFPGGMHYQLEHKLGAVPRFWQFYLSFNKFGAKSNDAGERPGAIAPAAGNQAELHAIDDRTLTVVNGSCVDYWLIVVASAGALPEPPGSNADTDVGAEAGSGETGFSED